MELGRGNGRTLRMLLIPLNHMLKMVKMVHFMVCVYIYIYIHILTYGIYICNIYILTYGIYM